MWQRTSYNDLYGCERFLDPSEWVFSRVTEETDSPLFCLQTVSRWANGSLAAENEKTPQFT